MNSYSILFFSLLCVQTVKPACIYKDFFTDSAGRLSRFSVHSVDKAVSKLSKAGYDIESVRKDFPGLSLHGLVNRILHAESLVFLILACNKLLKFCIKMIRRLAKELSKELKFLIFNCIKLLKNIFKNNRLILKALGFH